MERVEKANDARAGAAPPLRNSLRRQVGIFLWLALWLLLLGAGGAAVILWRAGWDARTGALVVSLPLLALSVSMMLSALVTWPAARKAARELRAFERGDFLLRWTYAPELWARFAALEAARNRRIWGWVVAGVWMFAMFIIAVLGIASKEGPSAPFLWTAAGISAGCLALHLFIRRAIRRGRARRLASAFAFIGAACVHCGGETWIWGSSGRALAGAALVDEPMPCVELSIGATQGAKNAMRAAGVGQGAGMIQRVRIPVPPGAEAEANRVVETLRGKLEAAR